MPPSPMGADGRLYGSTASRPAGLRPALPEGCRAPAQGGEDAASDLSR